MTQEEMFMIWAPKESIWSPWVSPVLFAHLPESSPDGEITEVEDINWSAEASECAVILDSPGETCIRKGVALLKNGFRPVPVINAVPGPSDIVTLGLTTPSIVNAVINMLPMVNAIVGLAGVVREAQLPQNALPAFLLDSRRGGRGIAPDEGWFDNRWIVIPQDFPSAEFLLRQGISKVLLVQEDRTAPHGDLAHVLLRWQERGIEIWAKRLDTDAPADKIKVQRPRQFKATWYRVLAMLGLRRSSGGGFGSYVPETTGAG